ncbi:MAG: DUF2278 family protein [Bacteroidales bacterium]|nr:DUF2278 family protein [Bacteroidales bacterium]
MPLNDGYGVVLGTVDSYYRDDPDNFGKYYHEHIIVQTNNGNYQCAIDVDSKNSAVGVEWRTVTLKTSELNNIISLGGGFHNLASNSASGAIDYIRSEMFKTRMGCAYLIYKLLGKSKKPADFWKKGVGIDAISDLEPIIQETKDKGLPVLIFGEPFTSGLGIHNIHQNQGDPAGTHWWNENGIWQDGCTILQQSADTWIAFLNKFSTQSYLTDDNGHPL